MKPNSLRTGLTLVLVFATSSAHALDTDGERLVAQVAEAYRAPTGERVLALAHPKSLSCLQAEPKYQRYLMRAETGQPIPANAKRSVDALAPDANLPYRGFTFPVRPSHVIRMEYMQSARQGASVTAVAEKHIVRDGGRWYVVFPCPTPEGMDRLKDMGLLE